MSLNCFRTWGEPAGTHWPCGPVVARLQVTGGHLHVCREDLDWWLDAADAGYMPEPHLIVWAAP